MMAIQMFKKILRSLGTVADEPQLNAADLEHSDEFPDPDVAARLLTAPAALMQLSLAEAKVVLRYTRPIHIPAGTIFIKEGDLEDTDFMVLVLDGDVTVESIVVSSVAPMTLTVLGPGSLHGELGLLDGMARSATCTASSNLRCMIMRRKDIMQLLEDDAPVGAKLVMAIAMRISDRLRDNTAKLRKFVQLTKALQQEINHLLPS